MAWRKIVPCLECIALVGLMLAACCWDARNVFVDGEVYFVDADCYSRLTRVQEVAAAPWRPVRFHAFENAPFGVVPHTTAPMDLAIAALAAVFRLAGSPRALDLAGAWVSPLLAAGLVGFLWWWGRRLALPCRLASCVLVAVSPIMVHGFRLGRPDHQSLIIFLLGVALACELAHWKSAGRRWEIAGAAAWATALWTSLYEPVILLAAVGLLRLLVLGKRALPSRSAALTFGAIFVPALVFEGWRFRGIPPEVAEAFPRWAQNIGELGHATIAQLFSWAGWGVAAAPVVLAWRARRESNRTAAALAILLVLLAALCHWQLRWGYFFALVFALSLPWALGALRHPAAGWTIFFLSLWPLAQDWDQRLFPDDATLAATTENRADAILLRRVAAQIAAEPPGIVLAPWWLSPAIAYWSGHPCIAGSSHQSLPGTLDSARFFLADQPADAQAILTHRHVAYVVAYEPDRIIANSQQVLGRAPVGEPLGRRIYLTPEHAPGFLRLIGQNQYFRLFATAGVPLGPPVNQIPADASGGRQPVTGQSGP